MSNPFASAPPPIAAPVVLPPPTMPDPQSPDSMAARRRAEQDVMGRAGRTSTILSTAMGRNVTGGGGTSPAPAAAGPNTGGPAAYGSVNLGSAA